MVIISYLPFPFTCPGKNKVPFFLVKDFRWDPHHQRTTIHCSRHKFPYNKSLATYKDNNRCYSVYISLSTAISTRSRFGIGGLWEVFFINQTQIIEQ
ncbi:hypothetical protein L1887_20788 [Cichorium endivia]|nr:hypothetical protein L1887_20788 [Cichorium endivia]